MTAMAGETTLVLNGTAPFDVGNVVQVGAGEAIESAEIEEVNQMEKTIKVARPLKFTYEAGTDVLFVVPEFVTTVVIERDIGRKRLHLADTKNFETKDPVSIGNDPDGPYQGNEIAEIDLTNNTITLKFGLVYKILANTQIRKIHSNAPASTSMLPAV